MADNQGFREKIAYIKAHFDCVSYANRVLNWPIYKDGDRYISLAPGSTNPTALIVHYDNWYDFKTGFNGDIIDLCAMAKYGGDKGAAIRDLGADFKGEFDESAWKAKTQELCNKIAYWHTQLRAEDIDYLHSRHISDSTIERLMIGFDVKSFRLIIPYFKNGYVVYYAGRDRYEAPPMDKQWLPGKGTCYDDTRYDYDLITGEIEYYHKSPEMLEYEKVSKERSKYQKAFLDGYNENVPWGLHTLAPDFRNNQNAELCRKRPGFDKVLCILEGMFDALSFEQEGFICLSPIGGYFNKKINQLVIDIARQFDYVFICFDSDGPGSKFNMQMAQLMFENRVPFKIGRLPSKIDGNNIKDVSDYYCAGGNLIQLVNYAQDGIEALAQSYDSSTAKEFKAFIYKAARFIDKADLVKLFDIIEGNGKFTKQWLDVIKAECLKAPSEKIIIDEMLSKMLIKYVEGDAFYIYDRAGYWKRYSDNAVKNLIAKTLGNYANGGRLNTVLSFLKARTTTTELFNRQEIVNFPNGILDLATGEMKQHSPIYLSSTQMSYRYDPNAKCPKWDKFIAEIMSNDPKKILLIHEMLGYVLVPDLRFQKCFILQGEGANGKSVVINVSIQVFGPDNCSTVPMSLLASPFDPIRLKDSLVNFMAETDTNIKDAEARFKALVAGDMISASYKGKDAIEFASRAVQIMSTNSFIKTNDTSRGFTRRIVFINFNETFEGKRANKNLTAELCEELPGIFNRVYEGYKRLLANMEFTQTSENDEMIQDFLRISDPIEAFFQEEIPAYTGIWTSKELYTKYVEWCKGAGHLPTSRNKFTRAFKTILLRERPFAHISRDAAGYSFRLDSLDTFNDNNAEETNNNADNTVIPF